ncbi:MAG: hypothetical protein COV67_10775 [Nitrospinae bacterium CG11_big_fil_rev_8_21_14_0_20_56_8]|nr:MAG: hypothetical protein COV67_10775 [Nitrospinae bacterium CG11_big_fil_rev_8_21_14_0_20_56_8]
MAEETPPRKEEPPKGISGDEPGIMENYGTFPLWLLKGIDAVTPDFLRTKTPPPKPKVRN